MFTGIGGAVGKQRRVNRAETKNKYILIGILLFMPKDNNLVVIKPLAAKQLKISLTDMLPAGNKDGSPCHPNRSSGSNRPQIL